MLETVEVAVIGGGPAGLAGAVALAKAGAEVTVLDENSRPGGQLFKQIHKFFGSREHAAGQRGFRIGQALLAEAEAAGVRIMLNTAVWDLKPELLLALDREGKAVLMQARKILLATGARENPLAFPGWTLPGVMGVGAAQTMINIHRVLPGRRFVIVGSGNVGLIVAHQIIQAGGEVAAIVEARSEAGGYEVHAANLRRQGIPILTSHTVKEARGEDRVWEVIVVGVDRIGRPIPGSERSLAAEVLCLAVGLNPLTDLACLAGCETRYIPDLGGYVPVHDDDMQTTVPGIYVAGDLAGVEEASAAMEEGRLAGMAIAASLGHEADRAEMESARRRLADLRRGPFGEARARAKGILTGCPREASSAVRADAAPANPGGVPSPARLAKGPVALIECPEEIPCNPCEVICPSRAISIGSPITNTPRLDEEACNGCGLCVSACPGRAVFLLDQTYSESEALLTLPYEYLPLPPAGAAVALLDRNGREIGRGGVVRARQSPKQDGTALVSVAAPKEIASSVRHFVQVQETDPDGLIVCRCEEVTLGRIREAIRQGAATVSWVKRMTRAGMGTCQGGVCGPLLARIIARELGREIATVSPDSGRPPARLISLAELGELTK